MKDSHNQKLTKINNKFNVLSIMLFNDATKTNDTNQYFLSKIASRCVAFIINYCKMKDNNDENTTKLINSLNVLYKTVNKIVDIIHK